MVSAIGRGARTAEDRRTDPVLGLLFKDLDTSDYVAGQVWAGRANFILLDQIAAAWISPQQ
jgi:hypothetical protein